MLELLRALNWMIRADVPWPTKRGNNFDFVLVGEPGVFALWVHDGDPEGLEEAAAGLNTLLDGVRVRPVVCRDFASLGHAHPEVLYCTPETALDLLIGLPPHEDPATIRRIATTLRDLEVPLPPEPEPSVVTPEPSVVTPEPSVVTPEPSVVTVDPKPAPVQVAPKPERSLVTPEPSVVTVEPSVVTVDPKPAVRAPAPPAAPKLVAKPPEPQPASTPHAESTPVSKAALIPAKAPEPKPAPVVEIPVVEEPMPTAAPQAEPARPLPVGRHRSERPRFARRTPPPPPRASTGPKPPKSTLALPTALAQPTGRTRGSNEAAQRFDNGYVYVPEAAKGPGPLKREFRAKPFLTGIVVVLAIAVAAGLGVKAWPKVAGLIKSDVNPTTSFGKTITTGTTDFHPDLSLTAAAPQRIARVGGTDSYAVQFSIANVGSTSWALPPRTAFVLVDSLGVSRPLAGISGVASARWAGSLKPTQRWSGRLVFQLRSGRTPLRLRFALASNGSDTATWNQPK